MNKEEIIEGNKIIAQFMGYEYFPFDETKMQTLNDVPLDQMNGWHRPSLGHYKIDGWYLYRTHNELRYHRDWNWLMTVLDKIENIADVEISIRGWRTEIDGQEKQIKNCIIRVPDRNGERDFETGGWEDYLFSIIHGDDTKILATYKCVVEFIKWYNDSYITKI